MKSTSDNRSTRFEFVSAKQFGHGYGGLTVTMIERGTTSSIELELKTEETPEELTQMGIDYLTALEEFFDLKFQEKCAVLTVEDSHAMVMRAENAKKELARAEAEEAEARARLSAHQWELDSKLEQLRKVDEELKAREAATSRVPEADPTFKSA